MTKVTVKHARTHLQFWGMQEAVPVEDLRPGMITMWNGGHTREVGEVIPSRSGKTFQIVYADGTVDHRRFRLGRLIAIDPDAAPSVELPEGVTPGNTERVYRDVAVPARDLFGRLMGAVTVPDPHVEDRDLANFTL